MKEISSWITSKGTKVLGIIVRFGNCFYIESENKAYLIDTGYSSYKNHFIKIFEKLKHPNYIIQTHTHYDHISNTKYLQETYNAKLICHKSEAEYITRGNSPLPAGTNWFSRSLIWLSGIFNDPFAPFPGAKPDILVEESFQINEHIQIIHTPGHTKGSISILVDNEIAVVGDCLFGHLPHSVFPPFADDVDTLYLTWQKLLNTSCDLFLSGHGKPITRERLLNEYNKRVKNHNA